MYIYRFHDLVAVNPPAGGKTFYLSAEEARQLIAAAGAIVAEIDKGVSFSAGAVSPTTVDASGTYYDKG